MKITTRIIRDELDNWEKEIELQDLNLYATWVWLLNNTNQDWGKDTLTKEIFESLDDKKYANIEEMKSDVWAMMESFINETDENFLN